MSDIVERLRSNMAPLTRELTLEAAAEIERLKAQTVIDWIKHGDEIEGLKAALQRTLESVERQAVE